MSAGHMFYDAPSGQEMYNLVPLIGSEDFCILVSVSGTNKKIVEIAKQLQLRGATLMSIFMWMKVNILKLRCIGNMNPLLHILS